MRAAVLAAAWLGPLNAASAASAQPVPAAPITVDGPSAAIVAPTGLGTSVARDGTGGLVYLKLAGGVPHVFFVSFVGGQFAPPVELDGALPGAASQPVIGASDGGAVVVAFINGGTLYVSQRRSASSGLSAPQRLAGAALNPSLQMTPFGKAYLAFTLARGAGFDVRAAYYDAGKWAVETPPLNLRPNDDAGSGNGPPAIAAAGDGVAIVAWGEGGHVYTRRVWGISPSVVSEQADGPLAGCTDLSADEPAIGTGGNSSFAAVAFHEQLDCGGQTQSRVLANRLRGSQYDGVVPADAIGSPATDGADRPSVTVAEYGSGWITSEHTTSGNAYALSLASNEAPDQIAQLNSFGDATPPYVTPAMAGYFSSVIAWQRDPGIVGVPEIRMRYGNSDSILGPELVLSSPSQGPTDAAAGLAAAGNVDGEVLVAWVQGLGLNQAVVADLLYEPPGPPEPATPHYVRTIRPTLTWDPSGELWGPVTYSLRLDGVSLGDTEATALAVSAPLAQGRHSWQVMATNPVAVSSSPRSASLFVDTIPPRVTALTLAGQQRAGSSLRLHVRATDKPPGLPAGDASGIALIVVRWGDRSQDVIRRSLAHVYRKAGRYRLTVVVVDRAGNATTAVLVVRIRAKPKSTGKR